MELEKKKYRKIQKLSKKGNKMMDKLQFNEALYYFNEALSLIPESKKDWEASTWLYVAIGDAFFFLNDFEKSKNYYFNALNCPDGTSNPYIYLRLGESQYELNEKENSLENLLKAYMIEGELIFEDSEQKYLEFLKENMDLK